MVYKKPAEMQYFRLSISEKKTRARFFSILSDVWESTKDAQRIITFHNLLVELERLCVPKPGLKRLCREKSCPILLNYVNIQIVWLERAPKP